MVVCAFAAAGAQRQGGAEQSGGESLETQNHRNAPLLRHEAIMGLKRRAVHRRHNLPSIH